MARQERGGRETKQTNKQKTHSVCIVTNQEIKVADSARQGSRTSQRTQRHGPELSIYQNTQEIERTILIGRNRTKRANFRGSPLFQKQKNRQFIQLILCRLDVGGWGKGKGQVPSRPLTLDPKQLTFYFM